MFFQISSKKKIYLVSIKNNLKDIDIENLGAELYGRINSTKSDDYYIISDSIITKNKNFLGYFLHGLKLKSYEFKKYKSKKKFTNNYIKYFGSKNIPSFKTQLKFRALETGTFSQETLSRTRKCFTPR